MGRSGCFEALYGKALSVPKHSQSGVVIPVEHKTATRTGMQAFGKRFWNQPATPRADLGGVGGIDLDHGLIGPLSLTRQHRKEGTPSRITHALGDVAAAQAVDVHILDGDETEASDQFGRNLVPKVVALIGDVLVQATHLARQFAMLATAPPAACAMALKDRQRGSADERADVCRLQTIDHILKLARTIADPSLRSGEAWPAGRALRRRTLQRRSSTTRDGCCRLPRGGQQGPSSCPYSCGDESVRAGILTNRRFSSGFR
jgi:hypothetical protein